jgi:hypothetical protein
MTTRADQILILAEDLFEEDFVLDLYTERLLRNFDEGLFHAIKSLFSKKSSDEKSATKSTGDSTHYDWRSPRSNDTGIYHYALMKSDNDFTAAIAYLKRVKSNFENEAKENASLKKVVDNITKAIDKLRDQLEARKTRYRTGGSLTHGYAAAHA